MVIDDNYMAMNDTLNTVKAQSAPVLATFSQMCPRTQGFATITSSGACGLPEAKTLLVAADQENAVKAGANNAPVSLVSTGAAPADMSSLGMRTTEHPTVVEPGQGPTPADVPGDTKQSTTGAAEATNAKPPADQASWTQTGMAVLILGLVTGVAYFGWKLLKH